MTEARKWRRLLTLLAISFTLGATLAFTISPRRHTTTASADAPCVHVAFCERVWSGPRTDDYSLVMVWSDGEIWTAPTSHLKSWTRITTVNHQGK